MDVFSNFANTPYDFLKLNRGGVKGDSIEVLTSSTGVFKERDGRVPFNSNQDTENSDATLHVRPSEPFLAGLNYNLVGNGIRHQDQDYLIVGQTTGRGGTDFGTIEHYRLTLRRESLSESNES
jgi:hypothetical protein